MKRIFNIAVALLCLAVLGGCSDDNMPTPIAKPEAQVTNAKYNSLTFEWQKVKDALQYSYTLTSPDGIVIEKNVTQSTAVTISGLQPSTTYTLGIRALSQVYSDLDNSETTELTATTAALAPVAKPELTVTKKDGGYVISWSKVANATSYTYRVTDASGKEAASGSVKTTKFTLTDLADGDYTAYVAANSTKGGYCDSEEASISFTVTTDVPEPDNVEGTWEISFTGWECVTDDNGDWTEINQTGSVTITKTGDNTYSLKKLMDNTITIEVNAETGVAAIPVQDFELGGYSLNLGDTSDATTAAVGTFEIASDGGMTITISGIGCHYGDDNYDYFYDGATLVLTK